MNNSFADRNVLLGVLAVQLGYLTPKQLVEAFQAWTLDRDRLLEQILLEKQLLSSRQCEMLKPLVEGHLEEHGGDAAESLRSLCSVTPSVRVWEEIADEELRTSLQSLAFPTQRGGDSSSVPVGQNDQEGPATAAMHFAEQTTERYAIVRPHAKGGLGEVFVARDQELDRDVALKQIQLHHAFDEFSRSRFVLEAEVTGKLEHPGIVPVYGLGTYADGRPFYAMRFIEGESLQQAIKQFHAGEARVSEHDVSFRKLLGRFVDVCNAVGYAHGRGVLHRDLKPGNVMLGRHGETLVVDWGLAKVKGQPEAVANAEGTLQVKSGSGTASTLPGSAVGTPGYLSPEQAEGRLDRLGPPTDIYSLGATLYTLLTGQVAIRAREISEVLVRTVQGDFAPPRSVEPNIPAALEAICLRAMATTPEQRYASCEELAEDVERWLAGEPVTAFAEPWSDRARRWVRKHRTLATTSLATLAVTLIGLGLGLSIVAGLNRRLDRGNDKLKSANEELQQTNLQLAEVNALEAEQRRRAVANESRAQAEAIVSRIDAMIAESAAAAERTARLALDLESQAKEEAIVRAQRQAVLAEKNSRYAAAEALFAKFDQIETDIAWRKEQAARAEAIRQANQAIEAQRVAKEALNQAQIAEKLAETRRQTAEKFTRMSTNLTMKAAGLLMDEGDTASALHWLTRALEIALPDDDATRRLARTRYAALIRDLAPLKAICDHPNAVVTVRFSRDGQYLITACWDGRVRVWSVADGKLMGTSARHAGKIGNISLHPTLPRFAAGCGDSTVRQFRIPSAEQIGEPLRPEAVQRIDKVAFAGEYSANGRNILVHGDHGYIGLWSVNPPRELRQYGRAGVLAQWYRQGQLTDDGSRLVVRTGNSINTESYLQVWDAESGEVKGVLRNPLEPLVVSHFAVTSPGEVIVVGHESAETLRHWLEVWDVKTLSRQTRIWLGEVTINDIDVDHTGNQCVLVSQSGDFAVCAKFNGEWEFADQLPPTDDSLVHVRIVEGGRLAIVGTANYGAGVIDLERMVVAGASVQLGGSVWESDVSTDGRSLAICGPAGSVRIFRMPQRDARAEVDRQVNLTHYTGGVQLNQVILDRDDSLPEVRELSTGRKLWTLDRPATVAFAQFDSKHKRLLVADDSGGADLWDCTTRRRLAAFTHPQAVISVRFSVDGTQLATSQRDGTINVWDLKRGARIGRPIKADNPLQEYWLARTNNQLLTVTRTEVYRAAAWNLETAQPESRGLLPASEVKFVTLQANGHLLIGRPNGQVQQWDVANNQMIGIPMEHEGCAAMATYSPDNALVVSGSCDMTARLWDSRTGRQIGESMPHPDRVRFVDFSVSGRMVMTVCDDQIVRLWTNTAEPRLLHEFKHARDPQFVHLDPTDRYLAIADPFSVSLWDVQTGSRLATYFDLRDCTAAMFTPDGKTLAMFGENAYSVRAVPEPTQQPLEELITQSRRLTGLHLNTDGEIKPLDSKTWQTLGGAAAKPAPAK